MPTSIDPASSALADLTTPALVVDGTLLQANIDAMAAVLPGPRLRPHVKAHKTTELARRQYAAGHHGFTCATIREVEGMAAAGLGADLLLANEIVDATRIGAVVERGARVTLAVDSPETIEAAASGGVREVVIDVNVGLPRCGCDVADAGVLADHARSLGLSVRGVMGYEGHLMMVTPYAEKQRRVEKAMRTLLQAHEAVGGELVTAGGTGTYQANAWANEIQAGSYVLMDTQYAGLDTPFVQAFWVLGTVISAHPTHAVADVGLKALGMDHGNPRVEGAEVQFVSDEHITFRPSDPVRVGDRVLVTPAHIDPTIAMHERMHVVRADGGREVWPVDLRGW
ncbi:metal-activated pyridoxal enzyme [Epidermidibacterium keratini]|uniref:Metal-activated pyridoxal enzyme n=1 Tax=Epidermidibacterium keratini TaxID=1891644 RepID=A0A7L4YP16_9ACTN|nr:alanine racemase [Epidermidibacterium keratini]QHC00772.1 metal-activated pyridoxal enzyme [Epidermidibacterium keratini]